MSVSLITINEEMCKKCKACTEICPNVVLKWSDEDKVYIRPERIELCFKCGQCMAVCSSTALKIEGLSYEKDFVPIPENSVPEDKYFDFLMSRRAVRNFKDKPVPKEYFEKIVKAISMSPPSFPPLKTELIVVQDRAIIRAALPKMIEFYSFLLNAFGSPLKRHFIKRSAGEEAYRTLEGHLIPLLKKRMPQLLDGTEDTITRDAPAMILFHADKLAENFRTDVNIALTYGLLTAHVLGLGGTVIDLIPPAINKVKDLQIMFGVPEGNTVVAALILGFPKYKYRRAVKRKLKSVSWI